MKNSIEYSWLQISDLHIFDSTEWNVMQKAFEKLPNRESVKFLVITGDLHQYGEDYSKTLVFLNRVLEVFGLTKRDIFIVPGNHDAGLCEDKEAYTLYIDQKIAKEHDCYKKYFVKGKLADCFNEYNDFIKDFYGDLAKEMYPNPEQVSVLTWKNRINILNLNTAIICDGNNEKKQIIDIYKLSNLDKEIDKTYPTIIIAHHAFDFLWKSHQSTLIRYITDWKVSAYLCGDLHKEFRSSIPTHTDSNTSIPCIVCGKATPDSKDDYSDIGCIVYNKLSNSNKVEVVPYIWNSERKGYDPFHGMDSDEHEFSFKLLCFDESMNSMMDMSLLKNEVKKVESIWLPDAENAHGKQTRFGTFTSTDLIRKYISNASNIWGLSAVKGIGKTFVLQIKKTKLNRNAICLPVGVKADETNNWGIDSISFGYDTNLSSLKEYRYIVILWKYSLIVYSINQMINISKNVVKPWWSSANPERDLYDGLRDLSKSNKISDETYELCLDENYSNLDVIIKHTISLDDWNSIAEHDIGMLLKLQRRLRIVLEALDKESIAILIDKIDQTLIQTNAEPPVDCAQCNKADYIQKCNNPRKKDEYCSSENALCKINCCYGCENYASLYSNNALRIYKESSRDKHVNLWQHFQLALVDAVAQIKTEYANLIKVYFTIRQEAFACENWLFGDNRKKVKSIVEDLWYTEEQQKEIFYDCIRNQEKELLFNADLKKDFSRIEECFVGVSSLCHPYATHLSESVFESIYRHSFDRTRDIQEYGEMLTENMRKIRECKTVLERGELVKELIEQMAAKLAFSDDDSVSSVNGSYYHEKAKLLPNHWADPENFRKLIMMFDRNLLFFNQARSICRRYNRITKCSNNCEKCKAEHHPISMLFKLGMLGQMHINSSNNNAIKQRFLHSKEITYIRGKDLVNVNEQSIYILHPALTKSIELLKNRHIMHFTGFILGKDIKIQKEKLESLMNDYQTMDKKQFDEKYFYIN